MELLIPLGPVGRYEWGRWVTADEQRIRYWEHELKRARLMSDEQEERKAHFMLKRFEELGLR